MENEYGDDNYKVENKVVPEISLGGEYSAAPNSMGKLVGNIGVEHCLLERIVNASISSMGLIKLGADQDREAKRFQESFCNGLFGKQFTRASGHSNEWVYIDWNGIHPSISAVEYELKNAGLNDELSEANRWNGFLHRNDLDAIGTDDIELIHRANISADRNSVRGMVVVVIRSGRVCSKLEAVLGSSSRIPFEGSTEEAPSTYSSDDDYFQKQNLLKWPGSPTFGAKKGKVCDSISTVCGNIPQKNPSNIQQHRRWIIYMVKGVQWTSIQFRNTAIGIVFNDSIDPGKYTTDAALSRSEATETQGFELYPVARDISKWKSEQWMMGEDQYQHEQRHMYNVDAWKEEELMLFLLEAVRRKIQVIKFRILKFGRYWEGRGAKMRKKRFIKTVPYNPP
ncbi:unnamed protein product [Cuscuta epithymum]|uniref:Uncharacterized protein n=1 Tax=Cuscuta epithymum TaxID=186058 RepID=A0AAV0C923_9ASTE|nr:unnamed protein product [Cuscuta epithymum]